MTRELRSVPETSTLKVPRVVKIVKVAGAVGDIKINSATNRIYFIQEENLIGVLNGTTNKVRYISAGDGATQLAVNTRTNRVYVTNFRDATVSVISGSANRVIATVPVAARPDSIGVHTGSNRIYAACLSGTIAVIHGSTNRIIRNFKVGGAPAAVAVNEPANRIYVTNVAKDAVHVIDGNTLTLIKTIKVGSNPVITPVINARTNRVYVPNNLSRFVSEIDGRLLGTSKPIQLGRLQSEIALNSVTNRIYVTSAQIEGKGTLFIIGGLTRQVLTTLSIPTFSSLLINPLTNRYYIGDSEGKQLFVYNAATNRRITTLHTGDSAGNMALNTRTNRIYVGNSNAITIVQDSRI